MLRLRAAAALAMAVAAWPAEAQVSGKIPVDLELAFVVDASFSIDDEETALQRKGYADAVANRRVLESISSGFVRSVALAYIEFAAPGCVRLSVPWSRVSDEKTALAFGETILAQPRMRCPGGNSIGEAIVFATRSIEDNGFAGTRLVIDVSGDGPDTTANPVEVARDFAVARGITINGLVIDRPEMPDLPEYYRHAIIGGPRAFLLRAESRETFAVAILKKMILEIAGLAPGAPQRPLKSGLRRSVKALMPSM